MKWYVLKELTQSDKNEITADIHVPPDSPWFCGHFPGEPILPGVAQLGMVIDAIRQAWHGHRCYPAGARSGFEGNRGAAGEI